MALEGLKTLPKFGGGAGLVDGVMAAALNQLQGLKLLGTTSVSPSVTASSTKATLTVSDASSPTLDINARLPGNTANSVNVATTRSTANADLFDLEAWFPDSDATPLAVDSFAATPNTITFAAAVSPTYGTGAGPFFVEGGAVGGVTMSSKPYWLVLPAGSPAASLVYQLAVKLSDAMSSTPAVVDLTGSTAACSLRASKYEAFKGVTMKTNDRRYAVDVVNNGRDGNRASEVIRLATRTSTAADPRPTDTAITPLASGATSVMTVTGAKRGDAIVGMVNLTTGAITAPGDLVATAKDKVCVLAGNIALGDKIVLLVLPR